MIDCVNTGQLQDLLPQELQQTSSGGAMRPHSQAAPSAANIFSMPHQRAQVCHSRAESYLHAYAPLLLQHLNILLVMVQLQCI